MTLVRKTFSLEGTTHKKFSAFCEERGLSMSKQIEFFMRSVVEEPQVSKEYAARLERLRAGRFVKVDDFTKRYG